MILKFNPNSTNVKNVLYGNESEVLQVTFYNGAIYRFFGVPEKIYKQFKDASSAGSYFHKAIKDKFRFRKVK